MIEERIGYLFSIALIAGIFYLVEKRSGFKLFDYIPGIVLIYLTAMVLAQTGLWQRNEALAQGYKDAKNSLLPAMLFLLLLQLDLRTFMKLGKKILAAFSGAVVSIMVSFVVVFAVFGFTGTQSGIFSALCGSWLGGTANMLAIGSAFDVNDTQMGYALIVDASVYALWVLFLLMLVKASSRFNRWCKTQGSEEHIAVIGCACTMDSRNYWLLLLLAAAVSITAQGIAGSVHVINAGTTMVLSATFLGVAGSFTRLSKIQGSDALGNTMLFLLVALIGSRARLEGFGEVPLYIGAGISILVLHGLIMVILAKLFRLDLFSISVASLSCVGGVASAPVLAASYHKNLVSLAVLLAVMGYLVGTLGGLVVGSVLEMIA